MRKQFAVCTARLGRAVELEILARDLGVTNSKPCFELRGPARGLLLVVLLFLLPSFCFCAESSQTSTAKLDQSIQEVISKREYQWRMPREAPPEEKQNLLIRFLEGWANAINKVWKPVGRALWRIYEWLRRAMTAANPVFGGKPLTHGQFNAMIIGLIALVAGVLLYFVWKIRKNRKQTEDMVLASAILPEPDLREENLVADQLPEEGWQRLAEDLLARGELRLAMRALFMSSLAHLAESQWITVAKFKSNHDYWREIQRRAHDRKLMQKAFYDTVSSVDCVWYGMHPVTQEMILRFRQDIETVKRAAA